MTVTKLIAKHIREAHFGGNWTWSNMRDNVADVTWEEAITPVENLNTIAVLFYHSTYFVNAILKVLEGRALDSKDEYSFTHPPIQSAQDWENMQTLAWEEVEKVASLVEQLPDSKLFEFFSEEKYGNYYRNLHGMIEHTHYHMGQIAHVKKLLRAK